MIANSRLFNLFFFYFYRISIFFLLVPLLIFILFYLLFQGLVLDSFYNFEKLSIYLNFFGYSIFFEYFFKYFGFIAIWFFYSWLIHCYTGMAHIFDEYLDDAVFKTSKNKIIREKHYKINFKKKTGGLFLVFSFFLINYGLISA